MPLESRKLIFPNANLGDDLDDLSSVKLGGKKKLPEYGFLFSPAKKKKSRLDFFTRG